MKITIEGKNKVAVITDIKNRHVNDIMSEFYNKFKEVARAELKK